MNREILRLAVPNIISNISVPLLSTVDTALMGHLSYAHLGAVGLSSMIFNFIYWNFGFLRMGTTGMTAQAFGREDRAAIIKVLSMSTALAVGVALLLILFQSPILSLSKLLLQVQPEHAELVDQYFNIRIWAAPASLFLFAGIGWFFGMQNAYIPLLVTLVINISNIGLSILMVRYLDMGIAGVAIGTVIAQYLGMAIVIVMGLYRYRAHFTFDVQIFKNTLDEWVDFIRINRDLFIRTICLTFAFAFFYSQSSISGALALASNVILLQFLNWMSYGIDGFAFASESLIGKYFGARNGKKLQNAIRLSFYWGGAFAIFYALIYLILGRPIITVFSSDPAVIEHAYGQLLWVVILPLVSFACYIWDGIFIGFTSSAAMRDSMLISLSFYLGIFYLLQGKAENVIWISLLVFLGIRGIIQTWMWFGRKEFIWIRKDIK